VTADALKKQQELISDGQALVHSLATKIHRNIPVRIDWNDLVAYGEVGLAEAARDFDPNRGIRFTTFAYYRVRGAIYDGVSKMTWTSRARYRRHRYHQMANEALLQEAQDSQSTEKSTLEYEALWLRNVTDKLAVVYLSSQQGAGDEGTDDAVFEDNSASAPEVVAQNELFKSLHEVVDTLPPQSAELIRSVYFEGATLQDAANRLGISKSWASRLHAQTLERMATLLRKLGAD
jgi:RNA polymerase sigma factor for flagellar operon FliA